MQVKATMDAAKAAAGSGDGKLQRVRLQVLQALPTHLPAGRVNTQHQLSGIGLRDAAEREGRQLHWPPTLDSSAPAAMMPLSDERLLDQCLEYSTKPEVAVSPMAHHIACIARTEPAANATVERLITEGRAATAAPRDPQPAAAPIPTPAPTVQQLVAPVVAPHAGPPAPAAPPIFAPPTAASRRPTRTTQPFEDALLGAQTWTPPSPGNLAGNAEPTGPSPAAALPPRAAHEREGAPPLVAAPTAAAPPATQPAAADVWRMLSVGVEVQCNGMHGLLKSSGSSGKAWNVEVTANTHKRRKLLANVGEELSAADFYAASRHATGHNGHGWQKAVLLVQQLTVDGKQYAGLPVAELLAALPPPPPPPPPPAAATAKAAARARSEADFPGPATLLPFTGLDLATGVPLLEHDDEVVALLHGFQNAVLRNAPAKELGIPDCSAVLTFITNRQLLLRLRTAHGVDLTQHLYAPHAHPTTRDPMIGGEDPGHKVKNVMQQVQAQTELPGLGALGSSPAPPESVVQALKRECTAHAGDFLLSKNAMLFVALQRKEFTGLVPTIRGGGDKNNTFFHLEPLLRYTFHAALYAEGFKETAVAMTVLGRGYESLDIRGISWPKRMQSLHDQALLATHLLQPYLLSGSRLPSHIRGISRQVLLALRYTYDGIWSLHTQVELHGRDARLPFAAVPRGAELPEHVHTLWTVPLLAQVARKLGLPLQGPGDTLTRSLAQAARSIADFSGAQPVNPAGSRPHPASAEGISPRALSTNPVETLFGRQAQIWGYKMSMPKFVAGFAKTEFIADLSMLPFEDTGIHYPFWYNATRWHHRLDPSYNSGKADAEDSAARAKFHANVFMGAAAVKRKAGTTTVRGANQGH
jgi:hypothetical protein